jgi:hypothetical protein
LTNVAHWTQVGKIELFETPILRIYTPANYEVLATWFTVFLHHDAAAGGRHPCHLLATTACIQRSLLGCSARPPDGAYAHPGADVGDNRHQERPHVAAYYLTSLALLLDLVGKRPAVDQGESELLFLLAVTLLLAAVEGLYRPPVAGSGSNSSAVPRIPPNTPALARANHCGAAGMALAGCLDQAVPHAPAHRCSAAGRLLECAQLGVDREPLLSLGDR